MGGQLSRFWKQLDQIITRKTLDAVEARYGIRSGRKRTESVPADIEQLERRALLSAVASVPTAHPTVEFLKSAANPHATPAASGPISPSQMQTAYGFNLVSLSNGANGTGQTIAIVDAFDDPTVQNDLKAFDSAYGLANPPSLTVMSQTGSTTNLPGVDPTTPKSNGWEVETALDVEWAHALAPGARIVLVEANSDSYSDLITAVQTAKNLPGVSVVSMSWGGGEFSGENGYDSIFTTPAGHNGVTFVASTGDSGAPGGFPAYSANVLAVGGTTISVGASGNYLSESGWSGSGGGISQYEAQPTYQKGVVTQSTTNRTIPDVAFDADPNTGVLVYDSYSFGASTPWAQIGGTSLSAPSWAAVVSIIDQGRALNGLGSLDGATQTLPMLYGLDKTNPSVFHDITTGNNGYAAGTGYDLVTGLGTPVVNNLVAAMSGSTSNSTTQLVFQQTPSSGTAGQALSPGLKVALENSSGQVVTSDNSTVTITINSGPGSFASGSTVSVKAVNGIATFSNLILDTSGAYKFTATDGSDSAATTATININAAQASKLIFVQQPSTGTVSKTLSSVAVAVEDQFGNLVTGASSNVTIAVASGPGSFSTGSTTTVATVAGIATFNNLSLVTAGAYTLKVTDGSLAGATSNSFTVNAASTGLSAPQNVTLVALSPTTAQLSWSSVTGAQGYRVFYVHGSQTTLLGSVGATTTSTQISGITPGSTVSFKVEAYNATSVADSAIVTVTMPSGSSLTAPVLSDLLLSATSVELMWTPSSGAQGYRVYYSNGSQQYLLGTVSSHTTSVVVSGLSPGNSYQFMVAAFSGSTVQTSNWVTVTSSAIRTRANALTSAFDALAGVAYDTYGRLRK